MASKRLQFVITAFAACVLVQAARAETTPVNSAYSHLPTSQLNEGSANSAVQPTAYFPPPRLEPSPQVVPTAPPSAPLPATSTSQATGLTIIPPANSLGSQYSYPGKVDEPVVTPPSDAWCLPPQPPCRTSSWSIATEIMPLESHVARPDFGEWPDDQTGLGLRFILGYENPEGLGVRGRFFGMGQDVEAEFEDVDLTAGAFDFDLYKRFFIEDSELVLGGGGGSRTLKFEQQGNGYSKYSGGGLGMFVEGFIPLMEFPKSSLGQVGRARATLTTGNWNDTTDQGPGGHPGPGNIIPGTGHDSLTVYEFGWGLEYRHRFGEMEDHSWYIALLIEHQRWQSDWMSNFLGSSVSFTGLNFSTGLSW
jgi:hypothetical protein